MVPSPPDNVFELVSPQIYQHVSLENDHRRKGMLLPIAYKYLKASPSAREQDDEVTPLSSTSRI